MVTNWSQVEKFPQTSVAVQVTVVVPTGNIAGALLVITGIEQLSVAVAVPIFTVPVHSPTPATPETSEGQVITGLITSGSTVKTAEPLANPMKNMTSFTDYMAKMVSF